MDHAALEKIERLYKEGQSYQVLVELHDALGDLPEQLYSIAVDVIRQELTDLARPPARIYSLGLLSKARGRAAFRKFEGDQILPILLKIAASLTEMYPEDVIRLLPGYDDSRVFETLVMIYRRSRNRDAALALGKMRKEEALPVLLDNYFFRRDDPSVEQAYLLKKYPLPEPGNSKPLEMDPWDRDMIVNILVRYLDEVETVKAHYADYLYSKIFPMGYDDVLARDAAYILAILYASEKTPAHSKKEIEARKDRPISCVYADYMYDSFQYDNLQGYVRFTYSK